MPEFFVFGIVKAMHYFQNVILCFVNIYTIILYLSVDLQLPMQLVPITTDVVSSNLDKGEVLSESSNINHNLDSRYFFFNFKNICRHPQKLRFPLIFLCLLKWSFQ